MLTVNMQTALDIDWGMHASMGLEPDILCDQLMLWHEQI